MTDLYGTIAPLASAHSCLNEPQPIRNKFLALLDRSSELVLMYAAP